ncbi:hypothetical protein [Streptomyces rochei]|uniref:hypothetical protein n=1 Tax=Streptomyces rochei TaxID=1928 RepID=UPI00403A1FF6
MSGRAGTTVRVPVRERGRHPHGGSGVRGGAGRGLTVRAETARERARPHLSLIHI